MFENDNSIKHAPTFAPYANEMVGELVNSAHVLAKKTAVRSDCDDDDEVDERLASSKFGGNFSI
jgi:hypothetical protein